MVRLLLFVALVALVVFLVRRFAASYQAASRRAGYTMGQGRTRPSAEDEMDPSPYRVLGVAPGASLEEITAAYRRMAQMYHPDKVASLAPEFRQLAERRMKAINAAYEELRRTASR